MLGTITVTVTLGVFFVIFVPPLVGVSPVPVVGFFFLPDPGDDPGSYAVYSTVPLELGA